MKKIDEMNKHERTAFRVIRITFLDDSGDWYNLYQDGELDYIPDTIEKAKKQVYLDAVEYGVSNPRTKEMMFATTQFMTDVIDWLFANDEDIEEISKAKGW